MRGKGPNPSLFFLDFQSNKLRRHYVPFLSSRQLLGNPPEDMPKLNSYGSNFFLNIVISNFDKFIFMWEI